MTPAPERPATEAGRHLLRIVEAWDLGERPDHMAAALADILAIEAATLVTDAGLRDIEDAMLAIANLPLTKERGDDLLRVIRAAHPAGPVTDAELREVQRYSLEHDPVFDDWTMEPDPTGRYVLFDEVAALSRQAEKETA